MMMGSREKLAYMGNLALEKLKRSCLMVEVCQLVHLLDMTANVGFKYFWLGFIILTSHFQEPGDACQQLAS